MRKILSSLILSVSLLAASQVKLEDMISSMILVGFIGEKEGDKWVEQIKRDLNRDRILGVYISKKNFKDKNSLKRLLKYLKSGLKDKKLFVTTPLNFDDFERDCKRLTLLELESFRNDFYKSIKDTGINALFWPSLDLKTSWSCSEYEDILLSYTDFELKLMKKYAIIPIACHFPGKIVKNSQWEYRELKPFYSVIKDGKIGAVLLDFNVNPKIDENNIPSFSYLTIRGLLREKMGFKGVVFSSDLKAKDLQRGYSLRERVIKSINSGVNILFFSGYFVNSSNVPKEVKKIIIDAVNNGEIDIGKIEDSYKKINYFRGLIK